MRKIGVFILLILLGLGRLSAQVSDNKALLTIQTTSIEVRALLDEITRQSGINFSFNARNIPLDRTISFSVTKASLEQTMAALKEKTGIDYREVEGLLVLSMARDRPKDKFSYLTLSGFVTDRVTGENLIGATLAIKGTVRGTVTNAYGYYSLPLPEGDHTILVSYIGYEAREVEISLQGDRRLNITLSLSSINLPSVIVDPTSRIKFAKATIGTNGIAPGVSNQHAGIRREKPV